MNFKGSWTNFLKDIPFTNCYLDEISLFSKGSLVEIDSKKLKIMNLPENKKMAVKKENVPSLSQPYQKDIEWPGFNISDKGL